MTDAKNTRPHLVAVGDAASEAAAKESESGTSGEREGRGRLFWLLAALLFAAAVGLVIQSQRADELRDTIDTLEGELFTTRTALDAYQARFDEVRDSVGGLQAQLEQLNALVSADPLAVPGAEPAAPEAGPDESTPPAPPAP